MCSVIGVGVVGIAAPPPLLLPSDLALHDRPGPPKAGAILREKPHRRRLEPKGPFSRALPYPPSDVAVSYARRRSELFETTVQSNSSFLG